MTQSRSIIQQTIRNMLAIVVNFFFLGNIFLIFIDYTYTWTLADFSIVYLLTAYTLSYLDKYFCDCDKW